MQENIQQNGITWNDVPKALACIIAQVDRLETLLLEAKCNNTQTSFEDLNNGWVDNQDVMQLLHISPRTLQTLRSNETLPFTRIGNKIYYRTDDIQQILNNNYTMRKIRYYGGNK